MADVVIYTTAVCPYCVRAKHLLQRKGVAYREVDVSHDYAARQALMEQTRRRTVPQIFINDEHIGGCDELYALERAGELDARLSA
jgi:glutaredoxin 3